MTNEADAQVLGFYDGLAPVYHLIYADWESASARQAAILDRVIRDHGGGPGCELLDFACGIGTQALGLAALGYRVTATDLSATAVARAREAARQRRLQIRFAQADMRDVARVAAGPFDVAIAADNALPHLPPADIASALAAVAARLRSDGLLLASLRDYEAALATRPTTLPPVFSGEEGRRRIVHQVWEWLDERSYRVHVHITVQQGGDWTCRHHVGWYRALLRSELDQLLRTGGFREPSWLMPDETGYHQPLVVARRS